MAARLGVVLYWVFGGLAWLLWAGVFLLFLSGAGSHLYWLDPRALVAYGVVVAGAVSWVFGRSCLFVLSGV